MVQKKNYKMTDINKHIIYQDSLIALHVLTIADLIISSKQRHSSIIGTLALM